jgi:MFS family permease
MVQTAGRVEGAVRRPNRWVVLAICSMSLFVVGLDTTIVNVALPAIGHGLQVGTRGLEWAVDAYTIALATLLISSGALADRIGRRWPARSHRRSTCSSRRGWPRASAGRC